MLFSVPVQGLCFGPRSPATSLSMDDVSGRLCTCISDGKKASQIQNLSPLTTSCTGHDRQAAHTHRREDCAAERGRGRVCEMHCIKLRGVEAICASACGSLTSRRWARKTVLFLHERMSSDAKPVRPNPKKARCASGQHEGSGAAEVCRLHGRAGH